MTFRGPIPGGPPGNPYGPGAAHQIQNGPPSSINQSPMASKAGQMPPNMPMGPSSLGPPSNTTNGHPPPNNLPPTNGAPPAGNQSSKSNQVPPFMTGYPPGPQNSSLGPVNNSQPINTTQNSQFPPQVNSNVQGPNTGMAMGGRVGPPTQNMAYSQPPLSSNGPMPPSVSSPSRPPPPGSFGSPQFQQAQPPLGPVSMSQPPSRPQMMGMPPMPSYPGGPSTMAPAPGQMMPPPPMSGPGGMRQPGMGPMPPSSMGGYPSNSTGINTSASVMKKQFDFLF